MYKRQQYPALRDLIPVEMLQQAPHGCLTRLRDHAVVLAREEVQAALQKLHDDLPSLDEEARARRRSQV